MLCALDKKNSKELSSRLLEYAILLTEHIHKEDEVLFPWLDSQLTEEEKTELTIRFAKSDKKLALDDQKYQHFIEEIEQQIQ